MKAKYKCRSCNSIFAGIVVPDYMAARHIEVLVDNLNYPEKKVDASSSPLLFVPHRCDVQQWAIADFQGFVKNEDLE